MILEECLKLGDLRGNIVHLMLDALVLVGKLLLDPSHQLDVVLLRVTNLAADLHNLISESVNSFVLQNQRDLNLQSAHLS